MKLNMPQFAIVAFCALIISSCTSSKGIRIPNPTSFELNQDKYYVTLKNGETYSTHLVKVRNDSAFSKEKTVRLDEIKKIETKKVSVLKSLGFATGVLAIAGLVAVVATIYSVIYGRTTYE